MKYDKIRQEIKGGLRISDVIQQSGLALKHNNGGYKACCPFHTEKTPSFHVSNSKGIAKCFGCGWYGDAIDFVMEFHKLSHDEAIILIAKNNNITYSVEDNKAQNRLYEVNRLVALAYAQKLEGSVVEYLSEKGVTKDTIEQWQLGLAPKQANFIEGCVKLGEYKPLFVNGNYDKFIHRLIVPLVSGIGDVIGFAGRTLLDNKNMKEKEVAKWINSSENELYSKSSFLFGLNHAKKEIRQKGYAIVVEGYLDCILLHQHGVKNVVAVGGTSLTQQQCRLLSYSCSRVIIMFDGDDAGLKATLRSIDLAINAGLAVDVVVLPNGEDPDDYIRKNGNSKLSTLIVNAVNGVEFKFNKIKATTTAEQLKPEIIKWLNAINSKDTQHDVATKVSTMMGYSDAAITDFISKLKSVVPTETATKPTYEGSILIKYLLLYGDIMLDESFQLCVKICSDISELNLDIQGYDKLILDKYIEMLTSGVEPTIDDIISISKEVGDYATTVILQEEEVPKDVAIELVSNYLNSVRKRNKASEIKRICDLMNVANADERLTLLQELSLITS